MFQIHLLAVSAATVLSIALGIIWYSPMVCGRLWMATIGVTEAEVEGGVVRRGWRFLAGFALHFGIFTAIAYLLAFFASVHDASFAHLLAVLSVLVLVPYASMAVWEKKSLQYALITGGYTLLYIWVGAGVIAYWPW